jgi:hypothetical protein
MSSQGRSSLKISKFFKNDKKKMQGVPPFGAVEKFGQPFSRRGERTYLATQSPENSKSYFPN